MSDHRPNVWLVGDIEHRDFADAIALVRATAQVSHAAPEVILIVESRPGIVARREVERLRRSAPLAAVISLCGSWCEGETRTGRPIAGATRRYWHEFPTWWRRQIELRRAGRCPEWARVDDCGMPIADCGLASPGTVLVSSPDFDSADAIATSLQSAGYRAIWYRNGEDSISNVAARAGVWLGGQLSDAEANELAAFCTVASPVIALLDFPRRDRHEAALAAGATAVLGKPWSNADLAATLRRSSAANRRASRVA
ncbi:MAG: hypothetical protein AB7G28_02980 [Pirellulales bacterium]